MNFIHCAAGEPGSFQLDVYTTHCCAGIRSYQPSSPSVAIHRLGAKSKQTSFAGRAWHYWRFYCLTLWLLVRTRPAAVLYFETFSAFPAVLYKKYVSPKSSLLIHYHEYITPQEYKDGMRLLRWFHRLERKIYGRAAWISHTNTARLRRFAADMHGVAMPENHVFPNYPPRGWARPVKSPPVTALKTVYIGAFSLDTMYVREYAAWVLAQKGAVTWDIYSLNITGDARAFILGLPGDWVKLHPGIEYDDLPDTLVKYDVGLILYTGHIPNWVDNAPNKLFEYWSAGLDVWFSAKMTGSLPFVTTTTYPRVLAVDFEKLAQFDWRTAVDRAGLQYAASPYFCEDVCRPLWNALLQG